MTFKNANELNRWLHENGIDTSGWGRGDCKTAVDLWREIEAGETVLTGPPPRRLVQVVELRIKQGNKSLIEAAQELRDGRIRRRQRAPSEKVKPGEDILQAAQRCLWEEVGVTPENAHFLFSMPAQQNERPSPSYPGLLSQYTLFPVQTAVLGLPEHDFWHDNAAYSQGDPVKRHFWRWLNGNLPH